MATNDKTEAGETLRNYAVGDRVIATRDIWKEADDYSPASMYARKGDVLIVRKVGQVYPVNVSHEDRTDNSFGVELGEIRLI